MDESDYKGTRYLYQRMEVYNNVLNSIINLILPDVEVESNVIIALRKLLIKSVLKNKIVDKILIKNNRKLE